MRKHIYILLACLFPPALCAQTDSIRQRVFLVGDAGEIQNGKIPVIDWLKSNVDWNDDKNLIVFLGDNIYPEGLPLEGAPDYPEAKKALDYQLDLLRGKKSKGYFIPGNHDWKGGKIGGWQRAINQVNYINALRLPNIAAYPNGGCPGPVTIEVSDQVVVVLMDSQWFLHLHEKPGPESGCEARTIDEFTAELRQIVAAHPNQLLILGMHHPMYTYGQHGGAYTLKSHIFPFADAIPGLYIPLPVLGSAYPVARGIFGTLQDTYHPLYRTMINEIEAVLKEHPNVVTAAGHEHSIQLIQKDSIYHIVSGSGSKLTRLRKGKRSLFAALEKGFAVLEVRKSGNTEVKFYTLESTDLNTPVFSRQLKTITPITAAPSMDTLRPLQKHVTVAANANLNTNHIRQFFFGRNYRDEWTQPVSVPVLDLGVEAGGLRPVRQTGGRQSKTLWLEEKGGKRWFLRPVGNFPEAAIPADLRQTGSDNRTEGTSGNYPYADLFVAPLTRAAGIPATRRKLVYVPDDPRLERYRADFQSSLAILEEQQPTAVKKTITTDELNLVLTKDNRNIVDQKKVLQTRLLENFVMDFDRGENQYSWATYDTAQYKVYYPIPRDNDQAFFLNEGLLPKLIRARWFLPQIQAFGPKTPNIRSFNYQARNFDHYFLNQLSRQDWESGIDAFLSTMTDEVLMAALEHQPPEVQSLRPAGILAVLQKRRIFFKDEMLRYYDFLSKKVSIAGSDASELFLVETSGRNDVKVTVSKIENKRAPLKLYERHFDAETTREIVMYGLEDNDSFVVAGGKPPITLRMVGGPGSDAYSNYGSPGRTILYDVTFDSNRVYSAGFINRMSEDPEVNRFNRHDYKYNFTRPAVWLDYNVDDGFKPSAQVQTTLQGFRKEPYASSHFLAASYATNTRAFNAVYAGDYRAILNRTDLVVAATLRAPYTTNFFGYGNDTRIDLTKAGGIHHYRVNYSMGDFAAYFAKQLQSWMRVGVGPVFQFISIKEAANDGSHLGDAIAYPSVQDGTRLYAGLDAMLNIDSRNNEVVPTRGAFIKSSARALMGANSQSGNVGQAGIDLRIFMSFVPNTPFVFATRFGAGHTLGDFEFPQAQYLSGTDNLRGFRRQRFAGRTMAYNNSELRLKIADFNTYLFRGGIGVLAFHDIGRVWADVDASSNWHNGYGGGIWYSPVKRTVIVGSLGFSKEERFLPQLIFGFQF